MAKSTAPSTLLGGKVIHAALSAIAANGGELPAKEVVREVERRVAFTEWELDRHKSGHVRWWALLQFFSVDCVKAGFLIKKDGVWYITPEGQNALSLDPVELLRAVNKAYREWRKATPAAQAPAASNGSEEIQPEEVEPEEVEPDETQQRQITVEEMEQQAIDGIRAYILAKNPYEFQDLVAALLRGMGYYTPFVAPGGKDGGIDVMAYADPLGTRSPRMKVQVKHKPESPSSVGEIRQLMGILQKDGDVGIFVSSGGFTRDAREMARTAPIHVELIDLERFIALWRDFYHKMADDDKIRLPLVPVYFLAPVE